MRDIAQLFPCGMERNALLLLLFDEGTEICHIPRNELCLDFEASSTSALHGLEDEGVNLRRTAALYLAPDRMLRTRGDKQV